MFTSRILLLGAVVLALNAPVAPAQSGPSYARQVRPFLVKYCLECHAGEEPKGDLNLETVANILKGGKSGPALIPGKPEESRLVLMPEHKQKPPMPPSKAKQPKSEEVAVLRTWVAAGAKEDALALGGMLPKITSKSAIAPPITALAYRPVGVPPSGGKSGGPPKGGTSTAANRPSGQILAIGRQHEILLVQGDSGERIQRLILSGGKVTALVYSSDGQWLAAACSQPGVSGVVYLLRSSGERLAITTPDPIPAHKDAILSLAFSPDGKLLASTGYDRVIKIWDVASGKELHALRDHSDSVYSLAWHPGGKLLASASADRAVKIWDVTTGKRLHTLGESTDWLYAVAFSPDGKRLAAGGVDKSIRVWEISSAGGKMVQSVFAHDGAVTRLIYSVDGSRIYSLGEDRVVRAWDTARLVEHKVYERQPDAVLSLAVRPDQKQMALGRYDGSLVVLEEATGKVLSQLAQLKPPVPVLTRVEPDAAARGQSVTVTLQGKNLDDVSEVVPSQAEFSATLLPESNDTARHVRIIVPSKATSGKYEISVKGPGGQSKPVAFMIDSFTAIAEVEPNDSPSTGQRLNLPASVVGKLVRAGEVDFYRFEAKAGQEVGVQVIVTAKSGALDPVLVLLDDKGQILTESTTGVLGHRFEEAGRYALGLRDRDYRGGPEMTYRLHIGPIPVVTSVFPLGIQRGTKASFRVDGVYLEKPVDYSLTAPPDAAPGSRLPLPVTSSLGKPLGNSSVLVGEFTELIPAPEGHPLSAHLAPWTANGSIARPRSAESWGFRAKKGERLILEVNARRLGSPLDSFLEILDSHGKPVPRATLRCLAQTFVTFRDHDSAGPGIRLDTWNDFAMNDYIWSGSQLLRIFALPKNPDDDCQFYSLAGQRLGFLETTPTHLSQGTPMYKVAIHPPGTSFPPNGFPVIHLDYRNDDGGPGFGKDSRIVFDAPADGEYIVRIGDTRDWGGKDYTYRLTVRSPRPNFTIAFNPTSPAVWKGGALPINVTASRIDGFEGPIDLKLENLPSGFTAPATSIPAEENSTSFALFAEAAAITPPKGQAPLKLIATAMIGGQLIKQEAIGSVPTLRASGDIRTSTRQDAISVVPGQSVNLTVDIERRPGFKARVPVDVRGLPHGVRVLDIGLNGILITEQETKRTITLYAEPWVKPMMHPVVVLARSEGTGTEHAARSVLLQVVATP